MAYDTVIVGGIDGEHRHGNAHLLAADTDHAQLGSSSDCNVSMFRFTGLPQYFGARGLAKTVFRLCIEDTQGVMPLNGDTLTWSYSTDTSWSSASSQSTLASVYSGRTDISTRVISTFPVANDYLIEDISGGGNGLVDYYEANGNLPSGLTIMISRFTTVSTKYTGEARLSDDDTAKGKNWQFYGAGHSWGSPTLKYFVLRGVHPQFS